MSNGPSNEQFEEALARVSALEIFCSISIFSILCNVPEDRREQLLQRLQHQFERRMMQVSSPTFKAAMEDCVERVFSSAIAVCHALEDTEQHGLKIVGQHPKEGE